MLNKGNIKKSISTHQPSWSLGSYSQPLIIFFLSLFLRYRSNDGYTILQHTFSLQPHICFSRTVSSQNRNSSNTSKYPKKKYLHNTHPQNHHHHHPIHNALVLFPVVFLTKLVFNTTLNFSNFLILIKKCVGLLTRRGCLCGRFFLTVLNFPGEKQQIFTNGFVAGTEQVLLLLLFGEN